MPIDFKKLNKKLSKKIKAQKFIFNSASAERILNLPPMTVLEVKTYTNQTVEIYTNQQVYTLNHQVFYQEFATSRKNRSLNLELAQTKYSNIYQVTNPENSHKYPVRFTPEGVQCKCRDYQKQTELLGSKTCCKHGYRVLRHLGFSSLKDYLAQHQLTAVD